MERVEAVAEEDEGGGEPEHVVPTRRPHPQVLSFSTLLPQTQSKRGNAGTNWRQGQVSASSRSLCPTVRARSVCATQHGDTDCSTCSSTRPRVSREPPIRVQATGVAEIVDSPLSHFVEPTSSPVWTRRCSTRRLWNVHEYTSWPVSQTLPRRTQPSSRTSPSPLRVSPRYASFFIFSHVFTLQEGIECLIEPINGHSIPGYFLNSFSKGLSPSRGSHL